MSGMKGSDEFYAGYFATAPPGISRRVRQAVVLIAAMTASIAAILVWAQSRFQPARFEFQQFRPYRGRLFSWPYPVLSAGPFDYVLAGEGKHGAGPFTDIPDGAEVELSGALAANGDGHLLELLPGSLRPTGAPAAARTLTGFGTVTLSGEIVDTKCHYGVMNPGRGKVHRDCAVRCLSGGAAPGFLVRDASGCARVFLLARRSGRWQGELLPYAAEPVRIRGEMMRAGSTWILETSLEAIQRE